MFQPKCARCKSVKHFTVSCPTKKATSTPREGDEAVFLSLLIVDGEVVPDDQKKFCAKVKKSWKI